MAYWLLATIVLMILMASAVLRINPQNIWDAFKKISGYLTAWGLGIVLVVAGVPLVLMFLPNVVKVWWEPVVTDVGRSALVVGTDAGQIAGGVVSQLTRQESGDFTVEIDPSGDEAESVESSESTGAMTHVVSPGETLGGIAALHQTNIDNLLQLNNLTNPNRISVGQVLNVGMLPEPVEEVVDEEVETVEVVADEYEAIEPEKVAATPTPTVTPLPTPTPNPFDSIRASILLFKGAGNRVGARNVLEDHLNTYPADVNAIALLGEIDAADAQLNEWRRLQKAQRNRNQAVISALNGYELEVVERTQMALWRGGTVWAEEITLKVASPGWLNGEEMTFVRGHIFNLLGGEDEEGTVFTVN